MNNDADLKPSVLLADTNRHRLVLQATLAPLNGDRFQPAGFPEIGHVIYKAPRPGQTSTDVCIMDSAASMANHLEAVCHASPFALNLHDDLTGLPHIECWTDGIDKNGKEKKEPYRLVVTSLSEGHRLASSYFISDKAMLVVDNSVSEETLLSRLTREFGLQDLGTKTHPLPGDWWNVFKTIFSRDPNSLVHGILFPSLGIKLPRMLTAQHEAYGAVRVGSSGVKFDRLGKTNSGQPIFAVDEETANEIQATFVLDLSLVRSFGLGEDRGLTNRQKEFLLELAFWKIGRLLDAPFRFRSNCDLRLERLKWLGSDLSDPSKPQDRVLKLSDLPAGIKAAIGTVFPDRRDSVTKVYWRSEELFRPGRDVPEEATEDLAEEEADGDEDQEQP